MGDKTNPYYGGFERPDNKGINLKAAKAKKRALQERFYDESPTKKTKRSPVKLKPKRRPFGAQPPPPDDVTNEDSSLLDLFNMRYPTNSNGVSTLSSSSISLGGVGGDDLTPSSLSTPTSTSMSPSSSASSMSPVRHSLSNVSCHSPLSSQYSYNNNNNLIPGIQPLSKSNSTSSTLHQLHLHANSSTKQSQPQKMTQCYIDFIQTPPESRAKKRQKLTPAPLPTSPSWGSDAKSKVLKGTTPRINLEGRFALEADENSSSLNPCLDWSLKTRLTLISSKPFGWNSNSLKSSEESSGTSAFARCIDIDPGNKNKSKDFLNNSNSSSSGGGDSPSIPVGSQLDTSLGAQFHQCCLYWQHPNLPSVNLFPREISPISAALSSSSNSSPLSGIRLEQKIFDAMLMEWVDSFRSLFQLLRTRQCPYFYVCANQFTCLFCAAGTQGVDVLQVYVTPSSKGFRDALHSEGIEFSTPCCIPEEKTDINRKEGGKLNKSMTEGDEGESDGEEAADKWLDEMGISQDVSLSLNMKSSPATTAEEKNKSTLVFISGTNTLAFFNFLINSKNLLIATSGPFVGLPPTLLGPVAFHGATLKQLQLKQSKSAKTTGANGTGDIAYTIEMNGPILPNVIHMLCPVLRKTVQDFKIRMNTLMSTVNLNLNARVRTASSDQKSRANAFELQNLSDCGLSGPLLEIFCRPDSIDTINSQIECKNGMYKWS